TPLYVLGLMGATRRLDRYDDPTWLPLFIVSGIGLLIILLGVGLQLLQLAVSIWQRKKLRDTTGDPWDGRTLEWSVPSPAPSYNFAAIPVVTTRDAFWEQKQLRSKKRPKLQDFYEPKNTGAGIMIAMASMIMAFAIIWHIWWLVIV